MKKKTHLAKAGFVEREQQPEEREKRNDLDKAFTGHGKLYKSITIV